MGSRETSPSCGRLLASAVPRAFPECREWPHPMIERKHRALTSIYFVNDAVASNLAMLCAWALRFQYELIPVTKGQQDLSTYIKILPIVTIVFPLAFAVQ